MDLKHLPARGDALVSALRGAGLRFLLLPVSGGASLLSAHLVIAHGGADVFAQISLLWGLLALLPFTDLGLGAGVVNAFASRGRGIAQPEDEVDTALIHYLSVTRVLALVALVILLTGLVGNVSGLWAMLLMSTSASGRPLLDVNIAVALLLCCFGFALPLSIWQRAALGSGLNVFVILLGLTSSIVPLAFAASFAAIGLPISVLAIAPAVALVVSGLLGTLILSRYRVISLRILCANLFQWRKYPSRRVFDTGIPMLVILLASPIAIQSDRYVLSRIGGPTAVASYALGAQLYLPALAVLTAGASSLWPHFARLRTEGRLTMREFWKAYRLCGMLAATLGLGLMVAGPFLTTLVGSGSVTVPISMLAAFAGLLIVQGLTLPSAMLLTDVKGLRLQAVVLVPMVLVNLVLSILLTGLVGDSGPLVASMIAVGLFQALPLTVYVLRNRRTWSVPASIMGV